MKKSLKDMVQPLFCPELAEHAAGKIPESAMHDVESVIEQNRGRSESELMSDLLGARQRGELDPAALRDVSGRIMPMLSAEQKQKLLAIMEQLE